MDNATNLHNLFSRKVNFLVRRIAAAPPLEAVEGHRRPELRRWTGCGRGDGTGTPLLSILRPALLSV